MQFENEADYDDTEKAWLKAMFKQMYYIEENDEWITTAHDWDEAEAIAFIRDVRNPYYDLTGAELREEVAEALIEASYQLAYQQVYVLNTPTEQEAEDFQQEIADAKKDAVERMIRENMTDEQVIALTHDMYPEDYRNPDAPIFSFMPEKE
tara:strand:+ start:1134 stop:1586 length:453 start_codon:yes stop_codon:yes gene_type:complete